jgi:hypothetical protein
MGPRASSGTVNTCRLPTMRHLNHTLQKKHVFLPNSREGSRYFVTSMIEPCQDRLQQCLSLIRSTSILPWRKMQQKNWGQLEPTLGWSSGVTVFKLLLVVSGCGVQWLTRHMDLILIIPVRPRLGYPAPMCCSESAAKSWNSTSPFWDSIGLES